MKRTGVTSTLDGDVQVITFTIGSRRAREMGREELQTFYALLKSAQVLLAPSAEDLGEMIDGGA